MIALNIEWVDMEENKLRELSQSEIRDIQLCLLDYVHKICVENQIEYFLSDGTLLGAIRHNGFIPWDDDIDVGMTRNNLSKFISVYKKNIPNHIFLQTLETDKNWISPVCRLIDTRFVCDEDFFHNVDIINGVFIDIQPYDYIPERKIYQKMSRMKLYFFSLLLDTHVNRQNYKKKLSMNKIKKTCKILISCFSKYISRSYLKEQYIKEMTRYRSCTLSKFGGNYHNNLQPEKNYTQLELAFFEGKQYYIPKYYDSILSKLYGDYMKLPPEEKRIGSHGIKCYEILS